MSSGTLLTEEQRQTLEEIGLEKISDVKQRHQKSKKGVKVRLGKPGDELDTHEGQQMRTERRSWLIRVLRVDCVLSTISNPLARTLNTAYLKCRVCRYRGRNGRGKLCTKSHRRFKDTCRVGMQTSLDINNAALVKYRRPKVLR